MKLIEGVQYTSRSKIWLVRVIGGGVLARMWLPLCW